MARTAWGTVRPYVAVVGGICAGWFVGGLTDFSSPFACVGLVPVAFAMATYLPRPGVNAVLLGVLAGTLLFLGLVGLVVASGGGS